ncbi:MAG: tyrosine-type recombinase/integrase [Candidatus Zixiibacteriota bacterium]
MRATLVERMPSKPEGRVPSQMTNAEFSLSPSELQRLIAAGARPRDQTLLRLLVETGMRRHEATLLRVADVDVERRLLVVQHGKGGKQRVIPVTQRLGQALCAIGGPDPLAYVFASRQRERLSTRQVNRIVADAGRRAGLAHPNPRYRQLTCHLLRHTFARLWKAENGSIESLSNILGHRRVSTTWNVYGRESLDDMLRNYAKTIHTIFGADAPQPTEEKQ